MNEKDAHKVWDEYHQEILNRRLTEAKILNEHFKRNSIGEETDLVLDFTFFSNDETGALNLIEQLKENYEVSSYKKGDYWYVDATSRPYAVNLNSNQHIDWVNFMHEVALSHRSIFSVWSLTDPKTEKVWSSDKVDTGL